MVAKTPTRTQVGIIGAGPAGLVLGELLADAGIDNVILESRDRQYVESRVRAGVLEQATVELLDKHGLSANVHAHGLVHDGVYLQFHGERHHIDMRRLTGGRTITVYGQQELVRDLIAHRLQTGKELLFEAEAVSLSGMQWGGDPVIKFRHGGVERRLACRVIAGCDGFHGVSRRSIPAQDITTFSREFPYAWLGILAEVAPSSNELVYSFHESGFALLSMRSPSVSRLYLQVPPGEEIADWPDERIWSELEVRLATPGWNLERGPVIEKSITPMRSFVAEPLRHGSLFLAGDSGHIVPPTGAKGLNLAIADVKVLAEALAAWFSSGDESGLDAYSPTCLKRIWNAQNFSTTMTSLMHLDPAADPFSLRIQRALQRFTVENLNAMSALADNYVGPPFDSPLQEGGKR
ncbi:MAG: 4-hydroxybenzoate 3-monooxygenase [Actinomycetota bacterium]|nr:4-hydroxybenzoate 3-monooxygenase [Actinomycetota bacterium]